MRGRSGYRGREWAGHVWAGLSCVGVGRREGVGPGRVGRAVTPFTQTYYEIYCRLVFFHSITAELESKHN